MNFKMKGSSFYGKNCKCNADSKSPLEYDFSKKNKEFKGYGNNPDNFGGKLANALIPNIHKDNDLKTNVKELAGAVMPMSKIGKVGKTVYNYFTKN